MSPTMDLRPILFAPLVAILLSWESFDNFTGNEREVPKGFWEGERENLLSLHIWQKSSDPRLG